MEIAAAPVAVTVPRMQVLANGDIVDCGRLPQTARNTLYKTELCKHFMETGTCRYSNKCQFAHGEDELRGVLRHPKYKTTKCKAYAATGKCMYGGRCRFIHEFNGQSVPTAATENNYQDYSNDAIPKATGRGLMENDTFPEDNSSTSDESDVDNNSCHASPNNNILNNKQAGNNATAPQFYNFGFHKSMSLQSEHQLIDLCQPFGGLMRSNTLSPMSSFSALDGNSPGSTSTGLNSSSSPIFDSTIFTDTVSELSLGRDNSANCNNGGLSSSTSSSVSSCGGNELPDFNGFNNSIFSSTSPLASAGNKEDDTPLSSRFSRLSIFQNICQ